MNVLLERTTKPLAITFIGVGGAGVKLIERLDTTKGNAIHFALVHTNSRVLESANCAVKLLLGESLLRGLGAGGDPEMGRATAEKEFEKLKSLCLGANLVVIIAGLGGGTATGTAPVLARAAQEVGALVLGFVALPFDFQGMRCVRQAQVGLQQLRAAADGVICVPNQKVCALFDKSTRAVDVFNTANELWADSVHGLLRLITQCGLIDVDFADLAAMLRGRHCESCCASVQAAGEQRSQAIIEKLFAHPLLDRGQALAESDSILVSLTGGPDLTITEVNCITDQLRNQRDDTNIVTGAGIDDSFEGRLAVTVIASKHAKPTDASNCANAAAVDGSIIETHFFGAPPSVRPPSHFIPPPPDLTPEKASQLLAQQRGKGTRSRNAASKMKQGHLPLEIVSKGRFEKTEPTIRHGEDLDVPTYVRRGTKLN